MHRTSLPTAQEVCVAHSQPTATALLPPSPAGSASPAGRSAACTLAAPRAVHASSRCAGSPCAAPPRKASPATLTPPCAALPPGAAATRPRRAPVRASRTSASPLTRPTAAAAAASPPARTGGLLSPPAEGSAVRAAVSACARRWRRRTSGWRRRGTPPPASRGPARPCRRTPALTPGPPPCMREAWTQAGRTTARRLAAPRRSSRPPLHGRLISVLPHIADTCAANISLAGRTNDLAQVGGNKQPQRGGGHCLQAALRHAAAAAWFRPSKDCQAPPVVPGTALEALSCNTSCCTQARGYGSSSRALLSSFCLSMPDVLPPKRSWPGHLRAPCACSLCRGAQCGCCEHLLRKRGTSLPPALRGPTGALLALICTRWARCCLPCS